MTIIEFSENFPDEITCVNHFKNYRLKEGITCKKCGEKDHYWMKSIKRFQCKNCRSRVTLKSGTVMQYSNLPFRIWYIAMFLMSSSKKSFSALEVQRQSRWKRYEPVWYMMHKIRVAMGDRDDQYLLQNSIEVDEGYFETGNPEEEKKEEPADKLKRGRGSQNQSTVLVMVESTPVGEVKKNRPIFKCGFLKMKVINNLSSTTINEQISENVSSESIVITDAYKSYNQLKEVVSSRVYMKMDPKDAGKLMPWVHIAISNAKRLLLSTYHQQDQDYLQNYLNEYCYKTNRRYFGERLFDRLIIACQSFNWGLRY